MNRPSATRVASRRLLVDVVMVFLDALRRNLPRSRRAFIDVVPPAVDAFASGGFDFLMWRVNVALHSPIVASKVVGRVVSAAKSDGPIREVVTKVIDGDRIDRDDVNALVDVLEGATVDVLNDITDVQSAAAALRMPVDQAIRITLKPRLDAARSTVQGALGN